MSHSHYLFGVHAVLAALEHEPETVTQIWLEHGRRDDKARRIETLARAQGITVERVKREALDARVEGRHQGVVARSAAQPVLDETALYARLDALAEPPLLLVLDGVQDPHNLGACLRTADAAGVHAVIAPRDQACGLTSTVRKVACGAAETVPFAQVTNLARCLKELKQRGIWVIGTDVAAGTVLFDADLTGPMALVLGAEGKGMRRLTREACDSLVTLPMHGTVQSLNVSVSAGVCLYEAVRQRRLAAGQA